MDIHFDKIEPLYSQNKKKVLGILTVVVVSIIAVFAYRFYQSQPKSVLSNLQVDFTGFDGYGELSYDYEELNQEIETIVYQSVGFSKEQVEDLLNRDDFIYGEISDDKELSKKLRKASSFISGTSYEFDKTSGLSNGDTITLTIKSSSSKSPIKKETKTFKVKGLEKTELVSTKKLLEDYPVEFVGFNGYGKIKLPVDDSYDSVVFSIPDEMKNYENGDKVVLTVSDFLISELKNEGKKLESDEIELEVTGLKEISEISNATEALAKNDTYVKAEHQNTEYRTYTIEKQVDYISYQTPYSYYDNSSSSQLNLVTIYKITETPTSSSFFQTDPTVTYAYYGYQYYVKSDNTLDLETASKERGYGKADYEGLKAELETDGYKEYASS